MEKGNTIYFYHTLKGWVWEIEGYKSPAYETYAGVLQDYQDYKPIDPIISGNLVEAAIADNPDIERDVEETTKEEIVTITDIA